MFQGFIMALLGLIPFLKELILGNQTIRQAIMNNKFVVVLGFVFMLLFGSMLYMRDAATAANERANRFKLELNSKVCPTPQTVFLPDPQATSREELILTLKAQIKDLEARIPAPEGKSSHKSNHHTKYRTNHGTNDDTENEALDRLYQRTHH